MPAGVSQVKLSIKGIILYKHFANHLGLLEDAVSMPLLTVVDGLDCGNTFGVQAGRPCLFIAGETLASGNSSLALWRGALGS